MGFHQCRSKMEAAGLDPTAIAAFEYAYEAWETGGTGLIPEKSIEPVASLPTYEEIAGTTIPANDDLLAETVFLKLNGGLGTGMGLQKAKSLLEVREGLTFLDLIVRQVLAFRESRGVSPRFMLMNSFSTSADTRAFLQRFPELGAFESLELLQNRVPKLDAASSQPVHWPSSPELEWCPPGHGDLYTAMIGSGWLPRLLEEGRRVLFVSNSDNLGATLDLALLRWFRDSDQPFVMEVTRRTAADRKGGHLARRLEDGRLILRESAQCAEEELDLFQDVERHQYFNTNNLWLRLDLLAQALEEANGVLPLPVIRNRKTVDPRDKTSPAVIQLETAMGAAIECFAGAGAVAVPRQRFAPVKTTNDLLALRSDIYRIEPDGRIEMAPQRGGQPPRIELESGEYKLVDQLEELIAESIPSLMTCQQLKVTGPVRFTPGTSFSGSVHVINRASDRKPVQSGRYQDCTVEL